MCTEGQVLLAVAREALCSSLGVDAPPVEVPPEMFRNGACFVTLRRNGELRGCIGSLKAKRSLVEDVRENARSAAFCDPRFAPLTADELDEVSVEVSLLSEMEPLAVDSEADLAERLRPGVDGLLLVMGGLRGTFLPAVWEQFPEPTDFVRLLKRKAGLEPEFWSEQIEVWRYTSTSWSGSLLGS